jgi:ATP-dependent Clp protease protease subunit
MGMAASMGSILLSGGTKGRRFIYKHGEVMIHQPSGGAGGVAADLEIQMQEMIKTKNLGAQILADNCGQPLEKISLDTERDYFMSAQEAKEYGIIDEVYDVRKQR